MKNIILFFAILIMSANIHIKAQNFLITSLNITQINSGQIKANLKLTSAPETVYNSYKTEIIGNIITLKVCYAVYIIPDNSYHEHNFVIDIPSTPGNYIFKVEIYRADAVACTFKNTHIECETSLNFTNPFTGTISLSTTNLQVKAKDVKFYPNPSHGIINLQATKNIDYVYIYDALGRSVFQLKNPEKQIDISHLKNGNYFMEIVAEKQRYSDKILINK